VFFTRGFRVTSPLLHFDRRYVNKDRNITKRIVQHAEARNIKGLFITVDAPQLGRREKACSTVIRRIEDTSFRAIIAGHADEI